MALQLQKVSWRKYNTGSATRDEAEELWTSETLTQWTGYGISRSPATEEARPKRGVADERKWAVYTRYAWLPNVFDDAQAAREYVEKLYAKDGEA